MPEPEYKPCVGCGTPIERRTKWSSRQWQEKRYCCQACQFAAVRIQRPTCGCGCGQRVVKLHSRYVKGHKPYDGPIKVFHRVNDRSGTRWYVSARGKTKVAWARIVMQDAIGRPLKPQEVVHHINRNPEDDRPENLMLFASNAAHISHHFAIGDFVEARRRPRPSTRVLADKICEVCATAFRPLEAKQKTCSGACRGIAAGRTNRKHPVPHCADCGIRISRGSRHCRACWRARGR